MSDWRLNGQEEYLSNKILYKITFPVFWETAYKDKNAFLIKLSDTQKSMLKPWIVGTNILKVRKFSTFGMNIASSVGRRH